MITILLTLLACSDPAPTLTSVDPAEVLPGATVKVFGDHFADGATAVLVNGDKEVALPVSMKGVILLEATVPTDLAPGVYSVRVTAGGQEVLLDDALTVMAYDVEEPCLGLFTANTQLSLARELVVVDRFYKDGERETLRIPIPEVEQVEYELVKLKNGDLCSVIYMRKKDGRRVIFDDDTRLNLRPRAYKLGNVMGRPTQTTRSDVKEDTRPVEEN